MQKIRNYGHLVKKFDDDKHEVKSNKIIGLFGFFALTGAAIINIMFYPSFASSGYNTILWLLLGGLLWFIPVALCAAEMATVKQWSQRGGLYNWTMMMMGKRWGWTAIFFQWFQITIIYYVNLDFIVTGIFFIAGKGMYFDPIHASLVVSLQREAEKWALMLLIFSLVTGLNLLGIKFNEWFSKFSLPFGIILPAILIIIFGFWAFSTHAGGTIIHNPWNNGKAILPSFSSSKTDPVSAWNNMTQLVIFASFIISYTGIEQSASLIRRVKKPGKNYPIAIFMVAGLLIVLPILASVAIVLTIAVNNPSFTLYNGVYESFKTWIEGSKSITAQNTAGVLQTYPATKSIFGINSFEASAVFKFISFLIVIGAIGTLNALIIEPSTGIHGGLVDMRFPNRIGKINRFKVHYNILILQWLLMFFWVTILSFVSTSGDICFTICINISVLTYLFSYILLFISYIKMNFTKRNAHLIKDFEIKGGKFVKLFLSLIGLLLTIFCIATIFGPPEDTLLPAYTHIYLPTIIVLYLVILIIPTVSYQINFVRLFKKPVYEFLKSKSFSDKDINKIWRLFKKDKYNIKISHMLIALGMEPSLIDYYSEAKSINIEA